MLPRNQDSGRRPRTAPGSTDKQDAAAHRLRLRLAARSFKRTKALFTAGPDLELLGPKFGREAVMIGDEITHRTLRWLLEELRVQLFAQELKTPVPVSAKRLAKLWQTLGR